MNWLKVRMRGAVGAYWIVDTIRQMRAQIALDVTDATATVEKRSDAQLEFLKNLEAGIAELRGRVPEAYWIVDSLRPLTQALADTTLDGQEQNRLALEATLANVGHDLSNTLNGLEARLVELRAGLPDTAWLVDSLRPLVEATIDAQKQNRLMLESTLRTVRDEVSSTGTDLRSQLADLQTRAPDAYGINDAIRQVYNQLAVVTAEHQNKLVVESALTSVREEVTSVRTDLRVLLAEFQARTRDAYFILDALQQIRGSITAFASAAESQNKLGLESMLRTVHDELGAANADMRAQLSEVEGSMTQVSVAIESRSRTMLESALLAVRDGISSAREDIRAELRGLRGELTETIGATETRQLAKFDDAIAAILADPSRPRGPSGEQLADLFAHQLQAITTAIESHDRHLVESALGTVSGELSGARIDLQEGFTELRARIPEAYWIVDALRPLAQDLTTTVTEAQAQNRQLLESALTTLREELSCANAELQARVAEIETRVADTSAAVAKDQIGMVLSALADSEARQRMDAEVRSSALAGEIESQLDQASREMIDHEGQLAELRGAHDELQALYELVGASHRRLVSNAGEIIVETKKPVAVDSMDYVVPRGTRNDNSFNLKFNAKLAQWIPLRELRVLDLGCAGGAFVKSLLDMGCLAVGIEGSDYSKLRERAEWATIPEYLFTADVTEPLRVVSRRASARPRKLRFTVVTAWEFFEHIPRERIAAVCANINQHLSPGGVVVASIAPTPDTEDGIAWHVTVEPKEWWIAEFGKRGFFHHEAMLAYFDDAWVRGGEPTAPASFHLVLTRVAETVPHQDRLPTSLRDVLTAAKSPGRRMSRNRARTSPRDRA